MIKNNIPSSNNPNIRLDGYRDMVQVYDPYKKSWVDYTQTGKIVLPSTITITTTTLNGQPVTCTIGSYSETTVFVGGVAVFKNIFDTGTATVTSGEFSVEVAVSEQSGSYEGVLEEITEIVLWDGSSFQNGAVSYPDISGLKYDSDAGSFKHKTLKFTMNNDFSNVSLMVKHWSESGTESNYFDSYGNISSGNSSSTFSAGNTYSISLNQLSRVDTVYTIIVAFYNFSYNNYYNLYNQCSKIWLE